MTKLGEVLTRFENGLLGTNMQGVGASPVGSAAKSVMDFALPGYGDKMSEKGKQNFQKQFDSGKEVSLLDAMKQFPDDALTTAKETFKDSPLNPLSPASEAPSGPTTPVSSDGGTPVPPLDYLYADLAKAYGMDASTAYEEALSNTSYRRAVADLKAAGINPMLMTGHSISGAGGAYSPAQLASDGISTGVASAQQAHRYYKLLSNIGTALGAGYGFFKGGVWGAAKGTAVGRSVAGAIGNLMDGNM